MEIPDTPKGWEIKSLIEINEHSWSAHLWGPDEYCYGYGSTLRYALLEAISKVERGDTFGRCSGFSKHTEDPRTNAKMEELLASIKPKSLAQTRRF